MNAVEDFPAEFPLTPARAQQPLHVALVDVVADLADGLRKATTLADVNIAAGICLVELSDLLNLAAHGTDQSGQPAELAGQLVNLALKPF